VFLTVLLSGSLSIFTPYLNSKVLYDDVLTPGGAMYGKVLVLVLSVAGASLLGAVIKMFNSFVGAKVAAFVSYDLKKTIFSSFERLSYSFFTSRHTGRLITQINSDAETLYWFFCDGAPYFLTNVLQIVGIVAVMLFTDPLLTLLILIPVPFVFMGYWLALKLFRRLHAENHTHRSRFNSVLSDVLSGMRIVKAFSREETEIARFDEKSRTLSRSNLTISLKNHTVFPLLNLGMRLTTYLVWGVGGYFVLREAVTPGSGISYGELNLFVSYLALLYAPLNFFAHFFNQLASGLNALQRLFEIMETEPEVKEKENAEDLPRLRGEVKFDHVNFSYAPGKKTIQDVSFTVPAGKTLGIVGHTGAGKSTLANLLTRLYDVDSGSITVDGVDIRDLSFRTLRDNIAIVSQETYLFRGTLLENIRYANPDATREEVMRASRAAGCHDFIMSFPDGYETVVGFDKKMLSGGEKQRISIARAILKDPAILILDEATAAMDTKTERRIQTALEEITKNRTTLTIAHRLSTLRNADFLVVVENGKIVEEGTHSRLLEKEDGVYRKLYRLQMEAMRTIGIEE
jgi:ATP-binding cassette subfamily B protein